MNDIAISIKNVSKYYKLYDQPKDRLKEALNRKGKTYHRKFYATKNLNLDIKKGEIIGIVGKNGSGKSTLLKLITGVLQPDEGEITVNGKISALLELGSGFNPEFTGMQNIFFYGTIIGLSKEEMQEKLDDILAFAEIGDFIHQPLKTYSSGMKSRLGFAVAVHIDPEILILDEVLAVGDILFRRKCYAKMEEFFKGGKTIIYVSHDANSVNELCTRAVFLYKGNIILNDLPKKVTTFYLKYMLSHDNEKDKLIHDLVNRNSLEIKSNRNDKTSSKIENDLTTENQHSDSASNKDMYMSSLQSDYTKSNLYNINITNPMILNKNNKKVNVLTLGDNYTFTFTLETPINILSLSYGAQIKGIKGDLISNASLKNKNIFIDEITSGTYKIQWKFKCNILPGLYYIDTSTTGIVNKQREILCRIFDHYMFKVADEPHLLYHGKVSLEQELSYEKID